MTISPFKKGGSHAAPVISYPSPEIELLLCSSSTSMDTEARQRVHTLLRDDINWQVLILKAMQHRVLPLLYSNLSTHFRDSVPSAVIDQMRAQANAVAVNNLFRTQELFRILDLLDAHDIPAIPYKGPILAATVYGDLSLRQFGDLDIFIRQEHALRAYELLISEGYSLLEKPLDTRDADHFQSHREFKLERDDAKVVVELQWLITAHWKIPYSFPLDPEGFWGRCERVSLAGARVSSLSKEDLLLVLCVHGANHHWARLMWICDIAELIRANPEMDWGQVIGLANRSGSERMFLLGLCLANDLLGAALPKEATQRIEADPEVRPLALQVRHWLFRDHDKGLDLFEESSFFLRVRERGRDRIPYYRLYLNAFLRTAITPNEKDQALLPLPTSFSRLYYILRPIRLLNARGLRPLRQRLGLQR